MSVAEPTRILIAEDHPLFLKGLRTLVTAEADLEIAGEVSDGPRQCGRRWPWNPIWC